MARKLTRQIRALESRLFDCLCKSLQVSSPREGFWVDNEPATQQQMYVICEASIFMRLSHELQHVLMDLPSPPPSHPLSFGLPSGFFPNELTFVWLLIKSNHHRATICHPTTFRTRMATHTSPGAGLVHGRAVPNQAPHHVGVFRLNLGNPGEEENPGVTWRAQEGRHYSHHMEGVGVTKMHLGYQPMSD